MGRRPIGSLLAVWTVIALADENKPATLEGNPTQVGLMTPAAMSELDTCIAHAAESAGDGQERRAMIGVYIGAKGRPVSLAVLESSGLEHLDKLVLRCLFRANYITPRPASRRYSGFSSLCYHRSGTLAAQRTHDRFERPPDPASQRTLVEVCTKKTLETSSKQRSRSSTDLRGR